MEEGIKLTNVLAAMINFTLLFFVLKHFTFEKVKNIIESRKKEIQDSFDKAKEDKEIAEALRIENQNNMKLSKQQGKEMVKNYKEKAEKVYSEIVEDAKNEAQSIIERARVEAKREMEKAQSEIKSQVIDLSLIISQKALEREIDEEQHKKYIEDFIAKVGN